MWPVEWCVLDESEFESAWCECESSCELGVFEKSTGAVIPHSIRILSGSTFNVSSWVPDEDTDKPGLAFESGAALEINIH